MFDLLDFDLKAFLFFSLPNQIIIVFSHFKKTLLSIATLFVQCPYSMELDLFTFLNPRAIFHFTKNLRSQSNLPLWTNYSILGSRVI